MINENIRICRLYCGFSYEDVAEAIKIPLLRYKNIETGKVEPTDDEIERISKIYNISGKNLKNGFNDSEQFKLIQDIDLNFFESEELREAVKLSVISLSSSEKKLIMLIRSKEIPEAVIEKLLDEVIKEE